MYFDNRDGLASQFYPHSMKEDNKVNSKFELKARCEPSLLPFIHG